MAYKCSFCGEVMPSGTGLMLAKNDGRILYFCSSKCDRSVEMGRKAKKRKWTRFYERGGASAKKKALQS